MDGKQLRNSILQWAIQGKLVPQDPNDEPAPVLLERIREEKARLVKEKKIKRDKNESIIYRGEDNSYYEKNLTTGKVKCIDEELPYNIPNNWAWCRMQDVISFINGRAYKKEELLSTGKYKVLRVGNFFTNDSWYYSNLELPDDKYCYHGDLLYAWSASFGPQIWEGDKTIFHYHIWNVKYNTSVLFRDYLYYFLLADKAVIKKSTTGSTMIHVSMENMKPRFIPIPPLNEQRLIVNKLHEILPIINQYSDYQIKKDLLNKTIKLLLRKSILQEAISGKLVEQTPNGEPAIDLIKRVKAEKEQLVKEGKLKKSALQDSIIFKGDDNKYYEQLGKNTVDISEAIPYDIPNTWVWCRLSGLICLLSGRDLEPHQYNSSRIGVPYITGASNIDSNRVIINRWTDNPLTISHKGDILLTCKGTIGKIAYNEYGDMHIARQLMAVRSQFIYMPFLHLFLSSYVPTLKSNAQSIIPGISREVIMNALFALPPYQEQIRIATEAQRLLLILQ